MKRIISIILVLFTALSLFSCAKGEEGELMGSNDPYGPDEIVMKSENFSYTRAEFSVIFYQYCNEYFANEENVDFYNVNPNVSLKDQIYYDDVSWFDYFAQLSKEYMETVLVLCEGAKAEGVSLTQEDIETIEDAVDIYVQFAMDYDYEEQEYFQLRFGADGSQNALREYLKKDALATKYEDMIIKSYDLSEQELSEHVDAHLEDYRTISYISYTFDEDEAEGAKAAAAELAAITDPAEFDSYILSYMSDVLQLPEEQRTTQDCYKNHKYYDKYSEFSKMAFDGAAVGTTYTKANEVDGQYTVYLLTKAASVRDDFTRNIRVVLIDINSHETLAKAQSYTEELLESWKAGEATEESFIQLVKDETDDESAVRTGGLLEGIAMGDTLPDGLEAWLFSSETAVGSTEIFKDSGSYYIVYYCGEGELKWKMDAEAEIVSGKYDVDLGNLEKKFSVESFDKVFNSLNV